MSALSELPKDIIFEILCNINPKDPNISLVSKNINKIYKEDRLWKFYLNKHFEEEILDETERERAIRLIRSIWNTDDFTRGEYRDKKKSVPDIDLPSCDKISKLFGSFAEFKINIKEDFLSEDIDMNIDNPTPEETEKLKERVKMKRILLFGNCRRAYEWDPIARKTRFGLSWRNK